MTQANSKSLPTTALSRSFFCNWLLRQVDSPITASTAKQMVEGKLEAFRKDTFALELATRLAIASTCRILGESFRSCYKAYGTVSIAKNDYNKWVHLTIVCLEDRTFGKGYPGSIMVHPVLDSFPALRNVERARTNSDIIGLARSFQAAFCTMNNFDASKPRSQGISYFDQRLAGISEPDDVWVVLAGLDELVSK